MQRSFLWFWFIVLAALSGSVFVFRLLLLCLPDLRLFVLRRRAIQNALYQVSLLEEIDFEPSIRVFVYSTLTDKVPHLRLVGRLESGGFHKSALSHRRLVRADSAGRQPQRNRLPRGTLYFYKCFSDKV